MAAPITPETDSRVEYLLQLLIQKVEEGGVEPGTVMHYGGRVDTYEELALITGEPNEYYFVGLVNSDNFDEYVWVEVTGGTGHWDRLGSVSIIVDQQLDPTSNNPIANSAVAVAIQAIPVVTVNSTGDVFVGSQCVVKNLTQDEYDALSSYDPKTTYNVVESSPAPQLTMMSGFNAAPTAVTEPSELEGE